MEHYYWNDLYSGWGWFLWFGITLLIFSSIGNWGYTYSAHRKYEPLQEAIEVLNARYARGEIVRDEYLRMKSDIKGPKRNASIKNVTLERRSPA